MLWRLVIEQLALIESAELEFGKGFGVITGETGAGKSLLLGAVAALSGSSVNKDLIRSGAETALVEGVFVDVRDFFRDDEEVLSYMEDDDQLILGREIRREGRNICRVNGRMVPLSFLRRIGERLADIHGQNDRQQIFLPDKHLAILDRFGREQTEAAKQAYARAYQAARELAKKERELLADPEERKLLTDRLRYQINEIKEISPQEGEDESLAQRRDFLANQEKLQRGLSLALNYLGGEEEGSRSAADCLALAYDELLELSPYAARIGELAEMIDRSAETVAEALNSLRQLLDSLDNKAGELEEVDKRLDLISRLKRKYGGDITEVNHYLHKAEERLADIEAAAEMADQLAEKRQLVNRVLEERGLALRKAREAAAAELSRAICRELAELGMEQAEFRVHFTEKPLSQATSQGLENCEFLLSANRGEALKPLARTASGGEASRIMLAIKVILAEADETPLLIFDEIDTGISGETTAVVGKKLKRLARSHQILCVTHQAQIAAKADAQFLIYKESDETRTRTFIRPLSGAEREREIARLLSGDKQDERSLELARQLLNEA